MSGQACGNCKTEGYCPVTKAMSTGIQRAFLASVCKAYTEQAEECGVKHPGDSKYVCDLPKGHTGEHRAPRIDSYVMWESPEPTAFDKAWNQTIGKYAVETFRYDVPHNKEMFKLGWQAAFDWFLEWNKTQL